MLVIKTRIGPELAPSCPYNLQTFVSPSLAARNMRLLFGLGSILGGLATLAGIVGGQTLNSRCNGLADNELCCDQFGNPTGIPGIDTLLSEVGATLATIQGLVAVDCIPLYNDGGSCTIQAVCCSQLLLNGDLGLDCAAYNSTG